MARISRPQARKLRRLESNRNIRPQLRALIMSAITLGLHWSSVGSVVESLLTLYHSGPGGAGVRPAFQRR
jgi:hypothetical protein